MATEPRWSCTKAGTTCAAIRPGIAALAWRAGRSFAADRELDGLARGLVQPVAFFELSRQVGLGQVLEVLVGQRVELVLEAAREHTLDLFLPFLLLEPAIFRQLLGAADVLVVELDADVAREAVAVGIGAGQPDELGLGYGHALALEREIDRALLDHRVDVVAPRVVVDEDVHGELVFLVQAAHETPDAAGRLAVAGEEDAVVAAPELVLGEAVPLGALLDEEHEVRRAAADLDVFGLDDGGHRVAALAQAGAVHPVAVVAEHHRTHDAPRILRAHVELFTEGGQGDFEVLDERVGFVLIVEGVLVRAFHGVLGAVVDLAQRGGEAGPLQLAEVIGHQHRLHELLRHGHVEERARLLPPAHLDDAALLVEVDVGEAAHGNGQGGILAPLGGRDHRVRHADELLLHRSGLLGRGVRHGSLYLFLRVGAFVPRLALFALGLAALGVALATFLLALAGRTGRALPFPRRAARHRPARGRAGPARLLRAPRE